MSGQRLVVVMKEGLESFYKLPEPISGVIVQRSAGLMHFLHLDKKGAEGIPLDKHAGKPATRVPEDGGVASV